VRGPALRPPRHQTVNAALEEAARTRWGLTFVDARERELEMSFAEVQQRALEVAGALASRGVAPGDRVAIVLPTGPDFMDAFFGALWAGAVPVPLYPPVRLGRIDEFHRATARMLSAVGARLVVTDRRVRLLLGRPVEEARPPLGLAVASELLSRGGSPPAVAPAPDALGLIQFSSGSTVDPKPVALEHRSLMSQCEALRALMPEDPERGGLGVSWLPLYHDMGLIGCLLSALNYAGPLVLIPPELFLSRPAVWLRAISRHRGTISAAPNFAYGLCLKRISEAELEGVDLSSWRYALNGAEPVSAEVARRFAERFSRHGFDPASLMPVYGLSEAALAVTFTPRRAPLRRAEVDPVALARTGEVLPGARAVPSVGAPIPGVEVEIRGEEGSALPEGRVGRVFARGPSVMREYFGDPGATAGALPGGWLDTGDLGFEQGGELHICGRAKDVVIIRGANHPPQVFEEALEGMEGLRAGCAIAVGYSPGDCEGEALLILAERAGELDGAAEQRLVERVQAAVVERTQIRPYAVLLLSPGTLPRTSSGKMRRAEALRRFLGGELSAPKKVTAAGMAAEVARSALAHLRRKLRDEA